MAGQHRYNVTLDEEYAQKLSRIAERTQIQEGTLARSLLSRALDNVDLDASYVTQILDGIDGAFEHAELGRRQAASGDTIALGEL